MKWRLALLFATFPLGVVAGLALLELPVTAWAAPNAACYALATLLLIPLHEAGHALVAYAVGLRVFRVVVGEGPPLFERRLGELRLRWNTVPLGGMTIAFPAGPGGTRLRHWLMALGGPAVNFAIAVLAWRASGTPLPLRPEAVAAIFAGAAPLEMIAFANAVVLVTNLIPRGGSAGMTDGFWLLFGPFLPTPPFREYAIAQLELEGMEHLSDNDVPAARRKFEEAVAERPNDLVLRSHLLLLLLREKRYAEARAGYVQLIADRAAEASVEHPAESGVTLVAKNNIAWANLFLGDDYLDEAIRYSAETVAKLPGCATASTRGLVLLKLDRLEPGLYLLRSSYWGSSDPRDRANSACGVALGEARRGKRAQAAKWVAIAERLDRDCDLLPYARKALAGADG